MMEERPILDHRRHVAPGCEPSQWGVMIHGFLGQGRNWDGVARRFVRARPDWGIITPDLRLHGKSQGFTPPHDVLSCADDLLALEEALGLRFDAVFGHSFGGKVALAFASRRPAVDQIWVLDSTPAPLNNDRIASTLLERMKAVALPATSRSAVVDQMKALGLASLEAQWVATNLIPVDGGFVWGLDLDAMRGMLEDFYRLDLWHLVEHPPWQGVVHVVRATHGDILDDETVARLERIGEAGHLQVHSLESGHWVNVGNPKGLEMIFDAHID